MIRITARPGDRYDASYDSNTGHIGLLNCTRERMTRFLRSLVDGERLAYCLHTLSVNGILIVW